ncbi:TonB-dependent receptor [uncultured Butyricimonas sp.]|jgi:tonB-linked outer membrane protein, susC/ragA family|uniref:SusC/RagA family TonB-linked outer membrane protein n=1 Tax=uncultured Butyricimonas sp. TaxID=1268785 RepID=UPI002592981E|nr:TonB-dependent receptor [uncultured Butyricimonas sp.]
MEKTGSLLVSIILCAFLFLTFAFSAHAQDRATREKEGKRVIKGRVLDENREPMIGVLVLIKGTTHGVTTGVDGDYLLEFTEKEPTLEFSFLGYEPRDFKLTPDQKVLNVNMKPSRIRVKEVVVVGFGTQAREKVTSSITKLPAEALKNVPYANVATALQGNVSGVQVQSTSGQPGAAPRIIVRGGTSINNMNGAAPIYIVDGIIRTDLADINSNDIESIQVLKDAASTAIYGARASNGVVIVTTKTGKPGKVQATYSYGLTVSEPGAKYDLASGREYIELNRKSMVYASRYNANAMDRLGSALGFGTGNDLTKNTSFTTQYLTEENKHKLNEGWESMPDPIDPSKTIIFKDTDFQDLIYQTAYSHSHNLTVSGGNERSTFYAGLGYMDSEGTAITTKYKRLSFSLNGSIKLRDNLNVVGRVMYTTSSNNEVFGLADIFYRSATTPPTAKYTYEDGTLAPGQNRSIGNPVYHLKNDVRKNSKDNLSLSIAADWEILPGFSFTPQLSLYKYTYDGYSFIPAYWNGSMTYNDSREATGSYNKTMQGQMDLVLGYQKLFAESHNLDVKAGFSYFGREKSTLEAKGSGAATDLIPTLNASAIAKSVKGDESDQVIAGFFARVNYDYKDRYLVSLSARYDGASNLGDDHKWGFFPGISVGWNVHNEKFWTPLQNIVSLKLRASYGVTGNISGLSDFQARGEYSVGNIYDGTSAILNSVIPNPDLKWEQSKTFDIGADIGLLNNRIGILFDYYRRVTDNLITSLSLPPSTGFASIYTNLGRLENKGIELEVNAAVLPAWSGLQWNVAMTATHTKHKILRLPENGAENNRIGGEYVWVPSKKDYAWMGGLQEGGRVGDIYGHVLEGVYATDEEAQNDPVVNTLIPGNDKTKYGGYAKFRDVDGNGQIDSKDKVYLGNFYPTWNGGFTNSFSFRGLTFSVRFDYTLGHKIYNYATRFMDNNSQGDGNLTKNMAKNSWKQQGDQASMPCYIWNQSYNLPVNCNIYVEKGDFLCLREMTLAYELPKRLLRKIGLAGVRVHVTGNNLHYFTDFKGLNPEEGGQDNGRYPIPRNIITGISITL